MDPISLEAVIAAFNTAWSGTLTGAAGEAGRRLCERLGALVRRTTPEDGGEDGPDAASHPEERAGALVALAREDPGLRRELAALLREMEELRRPSPVPAGAAPPRLLPVSSPHFTDRDAAFASITAQLDTPSRIATVVGAGGMGKTAATLHWAHALSPRFPDGQLFADLRGDSAATALAPSEVLVRFLHRLGVPSRQVPAGEESQADLFRDRTAGLRLLVVLDNAHSAAQVKPLLTAAPEAFTMITSRYRMTELIGPYGARSVRLGPLSPEDSVRLMVRLVGEDRFAPQRRHAESVVRRCAGSPYALCATGAQVTTREHLGWERLDQELAGRDGAGGEADGVFDADDNDPALLITDVSYRELSAPAARLYRLLGLWPWPEMPVGAAAAAAGVGEAEARRLLEELAEVHLLEETGEERYRFHDVVRRHAERQAVPADGPASAVRRVVLWHLRRAVAADARVIPGRWHLGPLYGQIGAPGTDTAPDSARSALAELRRERQNLAEAVRAAEEHGFDELAWQLCEAMWGLHLRLGFHEQWAATHRRGVAAAERCVDLRAEGRTRTQLAFALMGLERFEEAEEELRAAADADRRAGHRRGQATAVESLGLLYLRQWRYGPAAERFAEARDILGAIAAGEDGARDVPRARALLEHHIGRALRGLHEYTEAFAQLGRARSAFEELAERDRYNEARVLMSLAETHLDAGDPASARTPLDDALAVMESEGAALMRADAAELRARCARELADSADEARHLDLARALYADLGEDGAVTRVTARLAELTGG